MKANEFRIGNLTEQGEVKNFWEKGVHVGFGKCYEFNELKPIPLTEEWLLNLGFEEDGVWIHKIKNISNNRMIGIDLNNNHVFLAQHDAHNHFRDVFINKCEHVHQLQNLYFALTNEELTIK